MFTVQTKTATITNAVSDGSTIVYTATNTFVAGDIVHISGITPSVFNIPDAVITSRTSSNFTIASTKTGTYSSGGIAVYDEVKNHTISESTIRTQSLVLAEWNLNLANNIAKIGNYRYRPSDFSSPFTTIATTYSSNDTANNYTNATYADILIDGGYEDDGTPYFSQSRNEQQKLLMSLEDCFGKNRPRSGINKLMFFPTARNIPSSNEHMAQRPRYYVASKDDNFKYWSSFRTEVLSATITGVSRSTPSAGNVTYTANNNFVPYQTVHISNLSPSEYNGTFRVEECTSTTFTVVNSSTTSLINQNGTAISDDIARGVSESNSSGYGYYIDDAAPFVVYTEAVPANRIVVKMQTHIGTYDMSNGASGDQFYGDYNKQAPAGWSIQKLDSLDSTITAVTHSEPSIGNVTYTASNSFSVGDTVVITGLAPSGYNGTRTITEATSSYFVVANATTATVTDSNGTATVSDKWQTLEYFYPGQTRDDGETPIIKEDGYVELEYGLVIPSGYETTFYYAGDYAT